MRPLMLWAVLATFATAAPRFDITLAASARSEPVDGRLILVLSRQTSGEPRFQVSWDATTAQIFGIDVDGWKPGVVAHIDGSAAGHPLRTLGDLQPGTYTVQAVLNVYETF